jgi:ribosomal protein S18 acetylase RimI-like enzyme
MTAPQIRLLDEQDAAGLIELRRRSLVESPFSFLAAPEDDAVTASVEAVREHLKRAPTSVVFGAFAGSLVGMLGLYRDTHVKTAHKTKLWGMFVAPEWRRNGLAERLLEAAIAHARTFEGVTCVQLGVSESAAAARRLYEKLGFKTWGVEPEAIRLHGRTESEYHMRLSL